jgi:hypothetical protein
VNDATNRPDDWWTDQDRVATFLTLLESRRSSADQGMWQAPTLTIAAQAFLLAVLTDPSVSERARLVILVAGIAACIAAILSLVRLRAREILWSEAIAYVCDKAGLPSPGPSSSFSASRSIQPTISPGQPTVSSDGSAGGSTCRPSTSSGSSRCCFSSLPTWSLTAAPPRGTVAEGRRRLTTRPVCLACRGVGERQYAPRSWTGLG